MAAAGASSRRPRPGRRRCRPAAAFERPASVCWPACIRAPPPDRKLSYHYDAATGAFRLSAYGRAGDPTTVVYIPPEVRGAVAVSGAEPPAMEIGPDGSRLVTVAPSGGPFSITLAPATVVLAGCGQL